MASNEKVRFGRLAQKMLKDQLVVSYLCIILMKGITPRKTNMEPKNEGLEDVSPFRMGDFQVPC